MTEINSTSRVQPVFLQRAKATVPAAQGPTGGGATFGADSARFSQPVGGAGQTQEQYAQFVADSIAMLDSTDPRQRFQAIINMTKMQPNEAIPLLERATKNDNPQVVQLAQRALEAMKQMPATPAAPAVPAPAAPAAATPAVPTPAAPATPAVPTPAVPAATPAVPAAATPAPAMPAVPPPAPPAPVIPPAPTPYTGKARDFQALYNDLNYGRIPEAQAAAYEMTALAKENRQGVVAAFLNMIPATGFRRSDDVCIAAVNGLVSIGAKEAIPFFEALVASNMTDQPLKDAARVALEQLKGPSAAPAAAATPAAPAPATPAATPAAPAVPAAPAQTTVPAAPAAPAAPATPAAPAVPGFLKK